MSQNDLVIDNQSFPATRSDINSALQALGSLSSGSSAPATTYANMLWYDTTNNTLKMRAEANDQWISVAYVDQSADAFRILDDTQVVNTSGTQTGLLGDQATATWEAGIGTTESLVSPANVKAAIDALAPQVTNILGNVFAGPADVPTIAVTAGTAVVREGAEALGMGYAAVDLSTTSSSYVIGAQYTVSQAYSGGLRFSVTQTATYTGGGAGSAASRLYLRKNGVTISSVFSLSTTSSSSAVRSVDSTVASGDLFEWMHEVSGIGTSALSAVSVGGNDLYVAATPMIKASENPF